MNDLQIFKDTQFGEIRAVEIDGEPWFVGKDVATALGYANPRKAIIDHVDEEDKGVTKCDILGGSQDMTIINESGVYYLVLWSKLPDAKKFKRWITHEVIPSIRKHGAYMTPDTLDKMIASPEFGIRLLTELKSERDKNKALTAKVEADKPKTIFANAVSVSKSSILIGDLTNLIRQNGVEIGQKRLFAWIREHGYLMKTGTSYNMPTQYSMERSLFEVKETVVSYSDGHTSTERTTKVTGTGQIYFINKFLNKYPKAQQKTPTTSAESHY